MRQSGCTTRRLPHRMVRLPATACECASINTWNWRPLQSAHRYHAGVQLSAIPCPLADKRCASGAGVGLAGRQALVVQRQRAPQPARHLRRHHDAPIRDGVREGQLARRRAIHQPLHAVVQRPRLGPGAGSINARNIIALYQSPGSQAARAAALSGCQVPVANSLTRIDATCSPR